MRVGMIKYVAAAIIALGLASTAPAEAQDAANWPTKPVRIIVPTTAGGGNDAAARALAQALTDSLGKPFVVENVPGAGNIAGTARVAKAPPDGYTFLSSGISAITISPFLYKDLPYKPSELLPVAQLNESGQVLVVNPSKVPVKSLPELISLVKANPGKYNFGSNGIGGVGHLTMELLMLRTDTKLNHVPFKGGGDVVTALLGGHVDLAFNNTTSVLGQIQDGSLRPIAVPTPERIRDLPDVPTIQELVPGFEGSTSWVGIFAPAGTPRPIVDKMSKAIADYMATPEAMEFTRKRGAEPVKSSSAEFAKIVARDTAIWKGVIEATGVKRE